MRIKKFVISNIVLSIVLITVLYGLSWIYINYVSDETVKFMEYNKLPDNSVDIVSLGSSHGRFGLQLWEKNQMNLGVNSQYFYYDLQLLKKYKKKIKKGALVILPISIFSFYNNYDKKIDSRYVYLLEREKLQNNIIKEDEYFFRKNFSVIFPIQNLIKLKKFLEKSEYRKNYIEYPDDLKTEEKIFFAEETAKRHMGIESIYFEKNGEEDFKKLIKYIDEKEYKLILITTPFTYLYNNAIEKINKDSYKEKIYKNLKNIEKENNKNFFYLDYSHDWRITNNLDYFFDDNHLNEKGAKYFTDILLKDIEKEIKNERKIR